jgi:RNA polymerase sigma-70 factor (ECF subfamily)
LEEPNVWITRFLNGEPGATERLLGFFDKKVWYLVRQKIPSQETEDVYQDICLAVFSGLERLREHDKFLAWVLALARRKIHEFYRSREIEDLPFMEDIFLENDHPHAPVSQERALRTKRIHACIQELDEPYRETATYHFVLGLPYSEIALVMECNPNTAKARINRAKSMLFERLQKDTR